MPMFSRYVIFVILRIHLTKEFIEESFPPSFHSTNTLNKGRFHSPLSYYMKRLIALCLLGIIWPLVLITKAYNDYNVLRARLTISVRVKLGPPLGLSIFKTNSSSLTIDLGLSMRSISFYVPRGSCSTCTLLL